MATVYGYPKVGGLADLWSVSIIDPANLALVANTMSQDGLRSEMTYTVATGDPQYPLTVRVGLARDPKANGGFGETRISLRMSGWATCTVDGVLSWAKPFSAVLALNLPGAGVYSVGETANLIASLAALTWPSTDGSNVASTATLSRWSFGSPAIK